MNVELSSQEFNAIHEAALEIDQLRDQVESDWAAGLRLQAEPMAADQYGDEVFFASSERHRAIMKNILDTLPAQ